MRLTKCHTFLYATTKILPCLMQNIKIWKSWCAKKQLKSVIPLCSLTWPQSLFRNWVTAAWCILPWYEQQEPAYWARLGRSLSWETDGIRRASFLRPVVPMWKVLLIWFCDWGKKTGPHRASHLWQAVETILFAFTGTCYFSQEEALLYLHLTLVER